jgi:NAD(P)-dependent dehydrogenase (short-subunit alcohol dehydrogenase family)
METPMNLTNATALVTGANRGLGRALVAALLGAGVRRVYAGARDPSSIDASDRRVVPLRIDVTDAASIATLPTAASDVTLLVNNAGVLDFGSPLETTDASLTRQFATNVYGPLHMAQALSPVIAKNGGGAIVNLLSVVSLASMPGLAAYNASKAASWSLTQALRATLAGKGIAVHGVFPGPVDTEMASEITFPKTSAAEVARAIVAGLAAGDEDIFPDPMSQQVYAAWKQDHKAIERQFAAA